MQIRIGRCNRPPSTSPVESAEKYVPLRIPIANDESLVGISEYNTPEPALGERLYRRPGTATVLGAQYETAMPNRPAHTRVREEQIPDDLVNPYVVRPPGDAAVRRPKDIAKPAYKPELQIEEMDCIGIPLTRKLVTPAMPGSTAIRCLEPGRLPVLRINSNQETAIPIEELNAV
jgi:hypothetical protein